MKFSSLTGFTCFTALLCLGAIGSAEAESLSTIATQPIAAQAISLKQQQAQQLLLQSQRLNQQIRQACLAKPNQDSSKRAQQAWKNTMTAWVPFQGETIGPINQLDLAWSMQFWPDKKNITGRKIKAIQADDSAITAAAIQQSSVAVRGLGALELLLFEQGLNRENCSLSQAIAANIMLNSERLQQAWQQPKLSYNAATVRSEVTLNAEDIAWISELSHQLSFANKKFFMPLGKGEHIKPFQAESWRSQTSMAQLQTSFTSLQQLYLSGINALLISKGHAKLAGEIEQTFAEMLANWPTEPSMVKLLKSDQGLAKLYRMRIDVEKLAYLIQEVLPVKLKFVIGFNATDGD